MAAMSPEAPTNQPRRLIRIQAVMAMTGLSRSSVYRLASAGEFPQTVRLSQVSVAWVESEVRGWIESRIAARGQVG